MSVFARVEASVAAVKLNASALNVHNLREALVGLLDAVADDLEADYADDAPTDLIELIDWMDKAQLILVQGSLS